MKKIKTHKKIVLTFLSAICLLIISVVVFMGCASDGTYYINVPGYEDMHSESITLANTDTAPSANVSGTIWASETNKTYTFNLQNVKLRQYKGNIWYGTVECTDNVLRNVFVVRESDGSSTGTIEISSGGVKGSYNYTPNDSGGEVAYMFYSGYDYLKNSNT